MNTYGTYGWGLCGFKNLTFSTSTICSFYTEIHNISITYVHHCSHNSNDWHPKIESIDKEIGQILLTSILDKILSFSRNESISYIMHLKKGPTLISLGE